MLKRVFALIVTLAMILSLFAVPANAEFTPDGGHKLEVTSAAATSDRVTVTWQLTVGDEAIPDSFLVEIFEAGDLTTPVATKVASGSGSVSEVVMGLSPDTDYRAEVTAFSGSDEVESTKDREERGENFTTLARAKYTIYFLSGYGIVPLPLELDEDVDGNGVPLGYATVPQLPVPEDDPPMFFDYWTWASQELDQVALEADVDFIRRPIPFNETTIEGDVYLMAVWYEDYNLFVSADDYAEVYINGDLLGEYNTLNQNYYSSVQKSWVDFEGTPFVAVEAWDQTGVANISGFNLVLEYGDTSVKTDSSWYFYFGGQGTDWVAERPTSVPTPPGAGWMNEDYVAQEEWIEVYVIPEGRYAGNWAIASPLDGSDYIWSDHYDDDDFDMIDSPIYFRSSAPIPQTHTIEVQVIGDGGTASVTDEGTPATGMILEVPHGNDLTFEATPFANWSNPVWDQTLPETALEDGVYKVRFTEDDKWNVQYLVYPGQESLGSVSPTGVETFYGGETAPATASPASGYYFVGWFAEFYDFYEQTDEGSFEGEVAPPMVWKEVSDVSGASASYLVNGYLHALDGLVSRMYTRPVQEEGGVIRMYAKFDESTPPPPPVTNYNLTVNVVGDGSVPGFEGTNTFSSGTNVNLTAVEGADNFIGWTGDASGDSLDLLVVMSGDKAVTANFGSQTFTLTVNVEGDGSVQPFEGTQTFAAGTVVDLSAIADEPADENTSILFIEWTGDVTGDEDALSVTMDGDKTVTAVFDTEIFLIPEGDGGGIEIEDPILPQSGGLPVMAFAFIGSACIGLGAKLKKRK